MKRPEQVIATAYEDGLKIANSYGFQLIFEIYQHSLTGEYMVGTLTPPISATRLAGWYFRGLRGGELDSSPNLTFNEQGKLSKAKEAFVIERAALLASEQGWAGFISGRLRRRGMLPLTPALRVNVVPKTEVTGGNSLEILPRIADKLSLPVWTPLDIIKQPLQPQLYVGTRAVDELLTKAGLNPSEPSWFSKERGRQVLKWLIAEPFQALEDYLLTQGANKLPGFKKPVKRS